MNDPVKNSGFESKLIASIKKHSRNNFSDNLLEIRHAKPKILIARELIGILTRLHYLHGFPNLMRRKEKTLISSFNYLYDRLQDDYSKELLIKVLTFRLLGHRKVKLPLNDGGLLKKVTTVSRLADKNDYIVTHSKQKLHLHNLKPFGYDAKIYYQSEGVLHRFYEKEYEYKPLSIKANKNDVVIDGGACYGDTAIYFSGEVGPKGKVYSFEFAPENLKILYKNLSINPLYEKRVEVIERPLWSNSEEIVSLNNRGPANKVILDKSNEVGRHQTISLDDFITERNIKKIDFIKMDIEGAELSALKGAKKCLRVFKPVLAICVYHKVTDSLDIPQYIESLDLGYKFYFDHYSEHNEESVLFATVQK